jgi:Kef-type K+ transport system membrane component KefB
MKKAIRLLALLAITAVAVAAVIAGFYFGWRLQPWWSVIVVWTALGVLTSALSLALVPRVLKPLRRRDKVGFATLGPLVFAALVFVFALDWLFPVPNGA